MPVNLQSFTVKLPVVAPLSVNQRVGAPMVLFLKVLSVTVTLLPVEATRKPLLLLEYSQPLMLTVASVAEIKVLPVFSLTVTLVRLRVLPEIVSMLLLPEL